MHNSRVRSSLKWGDILSWRRAPEGLKGGGEAKEKGSKREREEGGGGGRPVKFVATKTAGFMARNLLRFHGKVTK